MKVLICNDDGYNSKGLYALTEAIKQLNWDAVIVAPLNHASGAARSRVSGRKISWDIGEPINGYPCYRIDASPATCAIFGITSGLFGKFDLCLSGINAGENLGSGITVSGTFGVALESAAYGIKSIALSREYESMDTDPDSWDWSSISSVVSNIIDEILKIKDNWNIANVNIPNNVTDPHIHLSHISKSSYFADIFNLETNCIDSGIGYNKDQLSLNDDLMIFAEKKLISVTLLKGQLI